MELLNHSLIGLIGGIIAAAASVPAPAAAQPRDRLQIRPEIMTLADGGATIGVSIRDVDPAEAERQKLSGGVLIEEVRANSPAEKAGLKRSDVVTEFDGERVRSARHLSRLVQETPPGIAVKIAVVRDGRKVDASITPDRTRAADILIDRERLSERLENLQDRIPLPPDFDLRGGRGRLGATVQTLTPQLAEYFGVKSGALVSAVSENTPASRAGLRAGDVIRTVNGRVVASRADLLQVLRDVDGGRDLEIGIVREKKENSLKVTLDPPERRQGRPARFTPARRTYPGASTL